MSGLCKVEMSAFLGSGRLHGRGADRVERARAGSVEGIARGRAGPSSAGRSGAAPAADRPARAAPAGTPAFADQALKTKLFPRFPLLRSEQLANPLRSRQGRGKAAARKKKAGGGARER